MMKLAEKFVEDLLDAAIRNKNSVIYELALKLNNEIVLNAIRVKDMSDLIGRLTDKLKNRDAMIKEMKTDFHARIRELSMRFDELDAQSNATIREMGEKIDADAALVVSLREMPFVCFADDPHAAIAAIVKADVDGAPVDWSRWPAGV